MMKDPRPARLANAEDTVLALHAEIERLRVREAAALKLAESYQVETERLTQERDLAKANADAVYAKLMPEVERMRIETADAKDDVLRLHRDKMDLFDQNIALRAAITEARDVAALDGLGQWVDHFNKALAYQQYGRKE